MGEDWENLLNTLLPEDWDEREKLLDECFTKTPREMWNSFLVGNMLKIEEIIFFERRWRQAIWPLRGLIASLDRNSKKKLDKQYQQLRSFETDNLGSKEEIEQIYQEILSYLQNTYFQGTVFAKPTVREEGEK